MSASRIQPAEREGAGRVAALALVLQPLVWSGVGRRYPWALLGLEQQAKVAWGVVAVFLLVGGLPLARFLDATAARRGAVRRLGMVLLLACPPMTAALDLLSHRHFAHLGYRLPVPLVALEAIVLLALVFWLRLPSPPGFGIALAAVAAAMHRLGAVVLFPLDERRSDMLTMLMRAVDVWRSGGRPYADVGPPGLKYLPGTWLSHAPSVVLGLDPRLPGAVLLLGSGLALARAIHRGARRAPSERGGLAEPLAMLVLLNPYHAFRHDLYFDAFLALTVAVYFLGARGRGSTRERVGTSVLVGLAIATRQWAWVYGPFTLLAVALGVSRGRGRAGAGRPGTRLDRALFGPLALAAAVCALTVAIVAGPWLAQDPEAFRKGVFAFTGVTSSESCLGAAALAASLGVTRILPFLQAGICLAGLGWSVFAALRGRSTPRSVLATSWFVWGAVVLLNPFLENYFYLSLGFAAAGLAVGVQATSDPPPAGR